eukprot:scaffold32836_cov55-Attheya_sp.AAC.2
MAAIHIIIGHPATVHSSFRGLVGIAIALRLHIGTGAKRHDVGRWCRDGRVHGVGSEFEQGVLSCTGPTRLYG